MAIFLWDHKLDTGVEFIDQQHRQIIEMANSFYIRRLCGKDKAAAGECLRFLEQYIQYHFQMEESYQMKSQYPRYRDHKAMHSAMATQVKFLSVQMADTGYAPERIEEFYQFIGSWIEHHILEEDMDFCRYYTNPHLK